MRCDAIAMRGETTRQAPSFYKGSKKPGPPDLAKAKWFSEHGADNLLKSINTQHADKLATA
jgi:hypothetical protein